MRRYAIAGVFVALVLLCAGLLFPAVQKIRGAAAQMACQSHFKQLALALHNYADTYPLSAPEERVTRSAFPAGTVSSATLPPEQRLSWIVLILPFFEQDKVFKQFDLTRGPGDPVNAVPARNRFQMLVCHASGEREYDTDTRTEQWRSPSPLTHYVGVSGVGADAAELPLGHPRAGVFGYDRRTALTDIRDGTSNTLLLIETANNPGHCAYGGFATVRGFEPDATPYLGPGRAFGGFHNGGAVLFGERSHTCNAAMADGAVKAFTRATAPEVLEALATVGGKEELPTNW